MLRAELWLNHLFVLLVAVVSMFSFVYGIYGQETNLRMGNSKRRRVCKKLVPRTESFLLTLINCNHILCENMKNIEFFEVGHRRFQGRPVYGRDIVISKPNQVTWYPFLYFQRDFNSRCWAVPELVDAIAELRYSFLISIERSILKFAL